MSLILTFTERLYLSDVSRESVVCGSTVYFKASLLLNSFRKRRTQQIMAFGVVPMNLVRVPKLRK